MKIWPLKAGEARAIEIGPNFKCQWCQAALVTNALPENNMYICLTNGTDIYIVARFNNCISCKKSSREEYESYKKLSTN